MIHFLIILFNPSSWFRGFKTSSYWDTKLSIILDCDPDIEIIDEDFVLVNGIKVCIFDYAYGSRADTWHKAWPGDKVLPSRITCMRLKYILSDLKKHNLDFV